MIKLIPLKQAISNKSKLVQLYKKDLELFVKTVRREGFILTDDEQAISGKFNRFTNYYHSGYIVNIHLINGEIEQAGIKTYNSFYDTNLKAGLSNLKLI